MGKKLKALAVSAIIAVNLMSFSGCDSLFKKSADVKPEPKIETPITSPDEDNKVKGMLKEYFKKLYEKSIDDYVDNSIEGSIPDSIIDMLATRTVEEGNNNPEIGIHLPRMVDINGIIIDDYEIVLENDDSPKVEASFVGNNGDIYLYYVKVDLKAQGLTETDFMHYYMRNPQTKLYERIKDENVQENEIEKDYDYLKVQARYDVEVIKEGNDYKVLTQREANYKPGVTNRLFILNNDFLKRIPYFDAEIEEEKKILDEEKALIQLYFDNLLKLDKERMNLINAKWNEDYLNFLDILKTIGISEAEEKNLLFVDEYYKSKFKMESFPLKINMERINKYYDFTVLTHTGYSQKNKMYLVSFKASVVNTNGMIGNETFYQYDYFVSLKDINGTTLIDSVKLNEYYKTSSPKDGNEKSEDTDDSEGESEKK